MAEVLAAAIAGSKIPDPIKMIPTYDGDQKLLNHWVYSVDTVLQSFDAVRVADPNSYLLWVLAIRQKIIGRANEALIARVVGTDWNAMRQTLVEYFGDRRDLSTLSSQIPYLRQGTKDIEEYYKETLELTANINVKVALDARFQAPNLGATAAVMMFVRDLTKSAFIDGLNEPYNLTVRSFRPASLEEAKSAAEEQIQSLKRSSHFTTMNDGKPFAFSQGQQKLTNQKKFQNRQRNQPNSNAPQRPFTSQNGNQTNYNRNNFGNSRPNANNFQNYPQNNYPQNNFQRQFQNSNATPMDVDTSMRSRQSAQPMSISERNRNHQVANVEQQDGEFDQNSYEVDTSPLDEFLEDEVNFHLIATKDPSD